MPVRRVQGVPKTRALVVSVSRHFLDCCFIVFTTQSSPGISEGRNTRLDDGIIERSSRDPCHHLPTLDMGIGHPTVRTLCCW